MTVATLVLGSLQATTLEWIDAAGRSRRTIIAKTTYALEPGTAPLTAPLALNEADDHWNDDPARSVQAPSDLAPFKPSAEVTLVGLAFAPAGKPVTSLLARLVVSDVDKTIEVFGDRSVSATGELAAPAPFRQMALRWERAAGGPETSNPVGVADADAAGRRTLPNLVPPATKMERGDEAVAPIGFGPLGAEWPERASRRGARPITFNKPLPADLVPSHFVSAPSDQRCSKLRPDERIVLENLHREHARLVTNLEAVAVTAFVERSNDAAADDRAGRAPPPIDLTPDSLWIDTDRELCTLTWRRTLDEIDAPPGRVFVALGKPRERLTYETVARAIDGAWNGAPHATEIDPGVEETFAPDTPRPSAALPFTNGVSPLALSSHDLEPPRLPNVPLKKEVDTVTFPAPPVPTADARRPSAPPIPPPRPSSVVPIAPPRSPSAAPIAPPPLVRDPALASVEPDWRSERASPWALGPSAPPVEPLPSAQHVATPAPAETPAPAAEPAPQPEPQAKPPRTVLELLWFDEGSAPRMRRRYRDVLEAVELDPDEVGVADDPRLDVHDVLVHAAPIDDRGVADAMEKAMDARGRFQAPMVLVAGKLAFRFADLDVLKVMIELAAPFGATDKRAREALDEARKIADASTLPASPAIDAALARVREVVLVAGKQDSLDALSVVAERSLVRDRRYEKRNVLGSEHLRCFVTTPGRSTAMPAYLPASIATSLPQFTELPVRVVAEAHLPQEQSESTFACLKILALARVVLAPRSDAAQKPEPQRAAKP